ncbi:hypothetical protein KI387_008788, partial [Taxus chinensis]
HLLVAMEITLTHEGITQLIEGGSNVDPTFQILHLSSLRSILNTGAQHRVDLSDGIHFQTALLPSKFASRVTDKSIQEGSIVCLHKSLVRMIKSEL